MRHLAFIFALLLPALAMAANVNVQKDTTTNVVTSVVLPSTASLAAFTGNRTFGNGSDATIAWTFNLSGTDPAITFGSGTINLPALTLDTNLPLTEIADIADNRILGNISGASGPPSALTPSDWLTFAESGGVDIRTGADNAGVAYGSSVGNGATMTLTSAHTNRRFVSATFTGTTATISLASVTPAAIGDYITVRINNTNGTGTLTVAIPDGLINPNRDPDTATSSTTLVYPQSSGALGFVTFASGNGSTWNEYYVAGDTFDGYAAQTATLTNKTLNGNAINDGTVDLDAGTFELPNGNDPNTSVAGQISYDLNGNVLRGYDGTNQIALGRKIEQIDVTVVAPNDLADAVRDACIVWRNSSGMSFVITGWRGISLTDDTTLNIEEVDADGANNATVDAVEIATNGTGIFTGTDDTITAGIVEDGHIILLDFDDTDAPTQVHMTLLGFYNADVN